MTFTGDAAADHVSVGPSQGELSWSTSGLAAIPPQCTPAPSVDFIAYCPWPQRIVIELGGGNDTFSVSGTAWNPFPAGVDVASFGDDTVSGLAGSDHIYGDEGDDVVSGDGHKPRAHCNYWTYCMAPFGNDTIDVRDGEIDVVDCGVGTDVVQADDADVLSNCEPTTTVPATVSRGGTTGVRLRFTKAGRRALRRTRTARLMIGARFTQRSGATITTSRSLTLRR
jgi:hypothetical protein